MCDLILAKHKRQRREWHLYFFFKKKKKKNESDTCKVNITDEDASMVTARMIEMVNSIMRAFLIIKRLCLV